MLITKVSCPECGAPLPLADGQAHVLCAYCQTSLRIDRPVGAGPAAAPKLTSDELSADQVAHLRQLVLSGKRALAISEYAKLVKTSETDAVEAVDRLMGPDLFRLLKHAPLGPRAIWVGLVWFAVPGLVGWLSLDWALHGEPGYAVLTLLCCFLVVTYIRWLIPKLISTLVFLLGHEGRGRVVKRAVVRSLPRGGSMVLVLFEVETPSGEKFLDEETLLLHEASLPKLDPGNIVRVRYQEPSRARVFPITPIEVVGRA